MPGSEAFLGDGVLSAASSLPMSGVQRRPAMICKFIAVGASCGARGDDGGGLARGGPHGLVPAMDAAAACCEDCREKDGSAGARRSWVRWDSWWTLSRPGFLQIRQLSVAGVELLSSLRYVKPLLVLAGHGGEGIEQGVSATLGIGGSHVQKLVPAEESFVAVAFYCHCFWSFGTISSYELYGQCSGCVLLPISAAGNVGEAFSLLGTCRRRVRASLLRFLRFSGREPLDLSSVMDIQDLQLNPSPRRRLPMRLLVEPLALRLDRLQEAPEEYDCRFCVSDFSSDPLIGSDCILQLCLLVLSALYYTQLGLSLSKDDCNRCTVIR